MKNRSSTSLKRTCIAVGIGLATLATNASGQADPDPDIFDASRNGVGAGNTVNQQGQIVNDSILGGILAVVDESQLPPIGSVLGRNGQPAVTVNGRPISSIGSSGGGIFGMPSGGSMGSGSSGSSGLPPLMGGGSSPSMSGSSSQQMPFPMPQGSQSSQGQSQGQSQKMPPMGKMPQSQGGSNMEGMPPPPPNAQIGDPGKQIGGQLPEGEYEILDMEGLDGEKGEGNNSTKNSSKSGMSGSGEEMESSDGQEMPEGIGGRQGSSRGTGVEQGEAIPTNM